MKSSINFRINKYSGKKTETVEDIIAVEEPLEISLEFGINNERTDKVISITMRTPGNDKELAAGFLFTEGIIKNIDQVKEIKTDPIDENKIKIALKENVIPELLNSDRNFYTTSSCGVCGKVSMDAIRTVSVYKKIKDNITPDSEIFYKLTEKLNNQQEVFNKTGGLHASALFDIDGKFELLREDVGRHNALDKLIGHAFTNDILPLNDKIVLLSGRASFELIQKAVMAGIRIVAAVGAPSSLAVELAKEFNVTLIGFLKSDRFNVYSGEKRIGIKY